MAWDMLVVLCTRRRLVLCTLQLQPSAKNLHGDVGVVGLKGCHVACSLKASVLRGSTLRGS